MRTTVESTDKHKVKLTIEVPEADVAKDLEQAYRKIALQVRVPGFRKGKAPRKVIDAQIGRDTVIEEFLSDAVPAYYRDAVREHELAPITDPDISLDDVEEGKPLTFTAEVEVRPRLTLEDYKGIDVQRPPTSASDEDVDELVERTRERFAELESVPRPAAENDYVVADIRATVAGEELADATRPDYLYAIGSGEFGPELDRQLLGKRTGEILKFSETLPDGAGEHAGETVEFSVLVKDVKGKNLPDPDDELAKTASEFDTMEELRADLAKTIEASKERQADALVRDRVLQTLVDRVDVDLPETLVDEETQHRVKDAEQRAQQMGLTIDQLLDAQGWDMARLREDAREHALRAIKADLVLEAVARQEELQVNAEEIGREIGILAAQLGREPKEVATTLERNGQVVTLAGDIIRSKALDLLVEHADITTEGESAAPDAPKHEDAAEASPAEDRDRVEDGS
jgi:trigger factor